MKTLLIVLIVGSVIGVSGLGVLTNEVNLDVQKLGVFPSITSFDGGFDCFSDGVLFVYQDIDPLSPNYNPHAKMICEWESQLIGFDLQEDYYGEGCSANFWSTHSGIDSNQSLWPLDYDPDYKYNEIFSTTYCMTGEFDFDCFIQGPTLQEVLEIQGVGYDYFFRESVAALLNAASDDDVVLYKYSVPEVLEMTQKAIVSGDYNYALKEFIEYNNYYPGSPLCPIP